MPPNSHCRTSAGQHGPDELGDDVAGHPLPGEVAAHGEGERDGRVQVGAADRAHEEDDGHHHDARRQCLGRQRQARAERQRADHASARGHEHEQERPPRLAEEAPVLEALVLEVEVALAPGAGRALEPMKERIARTRAAARCGSPICRLPPSADGRRRIVVVGFDPGRRVACRRRGGGERSGRRPGRTAGADASPDDERGRPEVRAALSRRSRASGAGQTPRRRARRFMPARDTGESGRPNGSMNTETCSPPAGTAPSSTS